MAVLTAARVAALTAARVAAFSEPGVSQKCQQMKGVMRMRKFIGFTAIAMFISCFTPAVAHDAKGLKSQEDRIKALPVEARAILTRHEELREPEVQANLIERAITLQKARSAANSLDPSGKPKLIPRSPLQSALEQVGDANAQWHRGSTISICFLDGADAARQEFMKIADGAFSFTDLKLKSGTPNCGATSSDVHVSFNDSGYYSYVGTDALLFDEMTPTLNLEGMGVKGAWSEHWAGIARHEIGHMLAMLHEHQHPDMDCEFKSDQELANLLNWSLADVKTNFAQIKHAANILVTQYDPKSEMHYQLGAEFFKDGDKSPCYITQTNDQYSDADKAFLSSMYPK
ncbi:M12 family metallopeptidase [Rhizobium phaseoli]|uniref:M12 family metallopeptidase n=1 Tax=Rhizobium phaseoli TaxID=396 RepID=UPI001FE21DCE|nr:M12 family metallopeptidase [Rhizobium phaseoli]